MKIHVPIYPCYSERCSSLQESIIAHSVPVEEADMIVVIGGDGTLVKAVHEYWRHDLPICGINGGTLGFLMNPVEFLDSVVTSKPNKMLDISLIELEVNGEHHSVFNEVCVGGDMATWATFSLNDKYDLIGSVKGGGMIFSTPQGSTGINKNNGGTILPLESNLWSITGDKCERNVNHVITPREIHVTIDSRMPISLWIDGNYKRIDNVKSFIIRDGYIVSLAYYDFDLFLKTRRDGAK